jgi:hypothetical protein
MLQTSIKTSGKKLKINDGGTKSRISDAIRDPDSRFFSKKNYH